MSVEAITWAFKQNTVTSSAKLTLIVMANCANGETFECWPSIAYICENTHQNRKTVIANIGKLVKLGLIEETDRTVGITQRVKIYRLKIETVPKMEQYQKRTEIVPKTDINSPKNGTRNRNEPLRTRNNNVDDCRRLTIDKMEDRILATEILIRVQTISPSQKESKSWTTAIRLMRERDKRTRAEILEMFEWANNHPFWQTNILCPATLRKQWPKLEAQRNGGGNGSNGGPRKKSIAEQATDARRKYDRENP